MSDKLTVALALVPMLAGVGLLAILQRPVAHSLASAPPATRLARARDDGALASDDRRFMGVVIAGRSAEVAAEADGRIARVWVQSGARLKRGDPILQIDRADVNTGIEGASAERDQRRSEELRAEARRMRARDVLGRLQHGGAWLSVQELETAKSELAVAEAELAAARSATAMSKVRLRQIHLKAARHVVTAPFDGVLMSSELDVGDSVVAGQVLARVVSADRRVRFGMPREYVPTRGAMEVTLQLAEHGPRVPATVIDVRPEVDSAAQLVFAVALPRAAAVAGPEWVLGARVFVEPVSAPPQANPER